MKRRFLVAALLSFAVGAAFAAKKEHEDDSYTSMTSLRDDYQESARVELIHPLDMTRDHTLQALGNVYRMQAKVVESFKGPSKAGDTEVFFSVFESEPNEFYSKSDRIVFLDQEQDEDNDQSTLMERENSTREPSEPTLIKMRKLAREAQTRDPAKP